MSKDPQSQTEAIAMRNATAAHGAVITGILPLATVLCGVWRAGERRSHRLLNN